MPKLLGAKQYKNLLRTTYCANDPSSLDQALLKSQNIGNKSSFSLSEHNNFVVMLDFGFASSEEIARELGARLKTARLSQALQQVDVAARAGVSRNTVNTLENTGRANLDNFLRVVMALGLADELALLFRPRANSIAQLERIEKALRKRAPRRPPPGVAP